jgi:hypothetical protein
MRLFYFYQDRNKKRRLKLIPKATKYRYLKQLREAEIGIKAKIVNKTLDFENGNFGN